MMAVGRRFEYILRHEYIWQTNISGKQIYLSNKYIRTTHLMMAVGRRRLWQRTALRMCDQLGPGACVQSSSSSSLPPSSSSSSPSSSSWGVCVQRKESSPFHQLLPSIGFRFDSRVGKVLQKANTEIYIFKCLHFLSFLTLFSHRHIRISTTLQKSFWLSVIVWHIPHQNFHYIWLLWCFVKFNFFSCFPQICSD